jgi:hypothetical protein
VASVRDRFLRWADAAGGRAVLKNTRSRRQLRDLRRCCPGVNPGLLRDAGVGSAPTRFFAELVRPMPRRKFEQRLTSKR